MNTKPKNDTPTLYPFRLEEAKLNKGNVVTRDGKPAEYIGLTSTGGFPHGFRIVGSGNYAFNDNGRWNGIGVWTDLFMTTPPPLPAQAPEAQTILRLTKQLDRWRSNIRNVVLQGDKTPMDDETLRDRAYTAIDTRVADERRLAKEANSRAESAEARIAALEGELREKVNLLAFASVREVGYKKEIEGLKKQLTTPTWIPVSTPPTEGDGRSMKGLSGIEFHGVVMWGTEDYACIGNFDRQPEWATFWTHLPPLPLPPTSPPEEETERKRFEKWYTKLHGGMPANDNAHRQYAAMWLAWQAASKPTPKTEA